MAYLLFPGCWDKKKREWIRDRFDPVIEKNRCDNEILIDSDEFVENFLNRLRKKIERLVDGFRNLNK